MQVTITGRHFETTEPIKKHIMEKIESFNKYFKNIIDVHIILSLENFRHIAEIVIVSRDSKFLSKGQTTDMYASIDKAIGKMEHQLRVHKERFRNHNKKHKGNNLEAKREKNTNKPSIIEDSRFLDKPMNTEEAVMELELQEFDFFVFKDASDDNKIKVIYKRKDKDYGLIEPE